MQPNLALVYSSQSGDGTLGFGWNLAGLSAISRCGNTVAQDGAARAVTLAAGDRYCMDGKRLRLTSSETLSTYGNASTTYQTEIADFSNVTASPTTTGNGPSYFTVKAKNGLTYEYGNPATTYSGGPVNNGSQVTLAGTVSMWLLDKVTDRAGNNYIITYSAPNSATGVGLPTVIVYTPASAGSTSYNYRVTFAYGTRVAQNPSTRDTAQTGYVAATSVYNPNLLNGITVAYTGATVHQYNFGYTASATTTRALLTSVTECAGSAGNDCYPATNITYQAGSAGVTTSAATAATGSNLQVIAAHDFNGDGLDDILYVNTSTKALSVVFGTTSGFSAPASVATFTGSSYAQIAYGDLLGLGYYDIVLPVSGVWNRYHWNGTSFAASSTGVSVDTGATQAALQDVNGDGLADLITVVPVGDGTMTIYTRRNSSSGSTVSFTAAISTNAFSDCTGDVCNQTVFLNGGLTSRVKSLDFNADGRADISVVTSNNIAGHTVTWLSSELLSTSTATSLSFQQISGTAMITPIFFSGNDDGCTDVADVNQSNVGYAFFSPCNGLAGGSINTTSYPKGAIDWDGDGRDDLLVQNGSTLGVIESTGNGLTAVVATSVPWNSNFFVLDKDGDGQGDIGVWTTSTISYYRHNSPGTPPDLLASITDGYGNSAQPTYVPTTASNYSPTYAIASYPDVNDNRPLYVVSQATFSDPSNPPSGTYNQQFYYYSAWSNLQGRGFEGFSAMRTLDSRNALFDLQYYKQSFPYTGLKFEDDVYNGSFYPRQMNATSTQLTLDSTANNQRYYPYFNSVTSSQREVGGTENGTLISTTVTTNGTPDSYGNVPTVTNTITDNDPASPYLNDSWTTAITNTWNEDAGANWCLTLLSQVQVAYTASIGSTVTRTKAFTPDTTNCRYTQMVTEPSSSTYKVTEALGYDAFGNISSDSVTGINMAARTTTLTWSNGTYTTGQFPLSVQDPSGATTQVTYNYSFGTRATVTDPNGLVTTWNTWDNFGRPTKMTNPDGTYMTWTYDDSASQGLSYHGMLVVTQLFDTGGTEITVADAARDSIDRVRMTLEWNGIAGTDNRIDTTYDSLGRVSQRSFPCAFSAWTTTCSYWTTNSYDVLNRLTQTQRPISSTNGTLQTVAYAYAGRTETLTDPYNNVRTLVTDVNGWQRQTKDAYGYTVTTAYDAAGSNTSIMDSDGHTLLSGVTWAYGVSPFLTAQSDVDLGAWSYTVDALGERTAWIDAKNQHFSETYDALSRPLTRSEPDYFTQWTWGSTPSSHNVGKLASVCTGLGTNPTACTSSGYSEAETYDSLGRQYQRIITIPSKSPYTYTYAYSATTGLLNTLTYPKDGANYAMQVQYGYQNGILSSVTDISHTPNVTVWQANASNASQQITQETLGNGLVVNRSFDAVTQWLGSVQAGVSGGSGVLNQAFLYDEMGNVTQRQNNNLGLTENIYYDNDYRLNRSTLNGTQNLAITYAANGNITSRTDIASGATWTYDTTHLHAVDQAGSSAFVYTYDANGNAVSRQGSTVTWSSYNYPTAISAGSGSTAESVALAYGPDRQRWSQYYTGNSSNEQTYYVGDFFESASTNGGYPDYRFYVYAGSEPVAVYSNTLHKWSYFLSDQQGSVASITNSTGGVTVSESFTPFGARRNSSTWSGPASNTALTTAAGISRQGYTFQTQLGLWMGLNHMNGRVQDAITGRFLSADPNIPDPTDAQQYNRYSYVMNNPLTFTDPSGFAVPGDDDPNCTRGGCGGSQGGLPEGQLESAFDHIKYVFVTTWVEPAQLDSAAGLQGDIGGQDTPGFRSTDLADGNPAQSQKQTNSSSQQTTKDSTNLPEVTVTAKRVLPEQPLVSSFIGLDDLLGVTTSALLDWIGCKSSNCQLAVALLARKGVPALVRDATGKVHGALPKIGDFKNASSTQIRETAEELRGSIQTRKQELEQLGEHGPHRARLGEEESLVRSLEKRLEDMLGAKNEP